MVLLHGWAASRQIWRDVQPRLARERPVWAFDLPGFGESTGPPGYAPEDLARPLVEAGRVLHGDPVVVVGHSLGAVVALAGALEAPDWVGRLVLVGPPHPADVAARIRHLERDAVALPAAWAMQAWARYARWRGLDRGPLAAPSTRRALHAATAPRTLINTLRALPTAAAYERAASLAVPALVVLGAGDTSTPPEGGRALARRIPGARCVVIDDARHHVMIDRPGAFVAALEAWLVDP